MVMPLAKLSREYINWKVIKTIAWGKRAKAMKRKRQSESALKAMKRAKADAEEGGCLSPPDDPLYVPGSSSEEQGPPEAEQGGCLSPLAKPRVGGCPVF